MVRYFCILYYCYFASCGRDVSNVSGHTQHTFHELAALMHALCQFKLYTGIRLVPTSHTACIPA